MIVPISPFNLLARVSAKNCLRTHLGLASQPHPWSSINSCPVGVCWKLQRMLLYRVVQRGNKVTALRVGLSLRVTNTVIDLTTITLRYAPSALYQYSVKRFVFLLLEPQCVLNSSKCKLSISSPNTFVFWFRTRIVGNNI